MEKTPLNNEQKLTQIYEIVMENEARRKRASFFRFLKWIVILGFLYVVATNPDAIMWRLTETLKPIILSTASGIIAGQKAQMIESMKDILPPGTEIQ